MLGQESAVPQVGRRASLIREEMGTRVPHMTPVTFQAVHTPSALVGPTGAPLPGTTAMRAVPGKLVTRLHDTGVDLLKAHKLQRTANAAADAAERQLDRGVIQELTPDNMMDRAVAESSSTRRTCMTKPAPQCETVARLSGDPSPRRNPPALGSAFQGTRRCSCQRCKARSRSM